MVDDEPDVLAVVKTFLEINFRADVDLATHGQEATRFLRDRSYDLLLTDYKMPVMDGLQLLTVARRQWPRTPRVLMTAYADTQLAIDAANEGHVLYFLTKPLEAWELKQALGTILAAHRANRLRSAAFRTALASLQAHNVARRRPS